MTYLILKFIYKCKNNYLSIQKWGLLYSQNKTVHCLNNYPKHIITLLILQTSNRLPRLSRKRWIRLYCERNALINASFSKMQSVLVRTLRFRSYDHLLVTNIANLISLFSEWRNTIGKLPGNGRRKSHGWIYRLVIRQHRIKASILMYKVHFFQYRSKFNNVFNINLGNHNRSNAMRYQRKKSP
jgi:hypothetical protein